MATDTSKESEKKTADDMAFRNNAVSAINSLVNQNKKLHEVIAESKKVKKTIKRPEAAKIQGLQTLKNTLGLQKNTD